MLDPADPLYKSVSTRRAAGEPVPSPVVVFLRAASLPGALGPNDLVRRKDAQKHLGLRPTAVDTLVTTGALPPPVQLSPGGTSVGWYGATILNYQLKALLRGCFGSDLPADIARDARLARKATVMRKALAAARSAG
jgi:hypothetical protein